MTIPRAEVPTWRRHLPSLKKALIFFAPFALVACIFAGVSGIAESIERAEREESAELEALNELGQKYLRYTDAVEVECSDYEGCGGVEVRCTGFVQSAAPIEINCKESRCKVIQ